MPSRADRILFAAVGDVHGHMRAMVHMLAAWEREHREALSFVLQVGDFEPHRTEADLATMAAPAKYRKIGDFPAFHRGEARFPWPVYFIGGNHEPYGFLDHFPEGGPVAENCHYLGRVGLVELAGLRIAGLSGIHSEQLFDAPRPPVTAFAGTSNKAYIHFIAPEVERALELAPVDVLLLHDWPSGLRGETVGNDYSRLVMEALTPRLVLCGHMHLRASYTLHLSATATTEVCCLANVEQGPDAMAVFEIPEDGTLAEVAGRDVA